MPQKVSRPLAVATAIAAVAFGALAAPTSASAHWSCGRAAPSDVDTTGNHHTNTNNVTSRVGTSASCAMNSSGINASQSLDYHCWATDDNYAVNEVTWTYVVVVGANKRGWIKDSLLADRGSFERCPGDTP